MKKHLNLLPALVVVFYDLDWNDPLWKEKQTECASRVAVVRSSLQERNTKLAVVLIQKNMPLPPGEDPQAVQRAEALCQACELPSKSLFVLPFSDHLHGYVTRLEGAFYDIALAYYNNEARVVKQHKELLNKSQHQLLFVRHQVKIAFYNELKQDPHVALKHYKQAYQYILEQKLTDINNLEIKLVAGFLNYKICRISFRLTAPLDAISQFRKHIDYFKSKKGTAELEYEHSAWMAKQFSLFGDLFNEAIRSGLQAIQTQHPGFYYQQAANHSMMRMKSCQELCRYSAQTNLETSDVLEGLTNLEFYGQRPWRQGCQANEAPDVLVEKAGNISLQAQELKVEHFWIIIPLLSSAVAQFREYKSVRMKLYLMVQMGQEYSNAKDYGKALTLLNRVTPYYRGERWWTLLSNVLKTALRCAYLTASMSDYVTTCLELVGNYCDLDQDEKSRIQLNLIRIIENKLPEPEVDCDAESVNTANEIWGNHLNDENKELCTIDMENLASFVECRACFDADSFNVDEVATVKVYLRSISSFPISFKELGLQFNNSVYNSECIKTSSGTENSDHWLEPKKVKVQSFSFILSPADVNKKLEVKQIYLRLGSNIILRWMGAGLDANISPSYDSTNYGGERLPVKYASDGNILWNSVTICPFTDVLPRPAKVLFDIKHDGPALVDEFYQFVVSIDNVESSVITNTRLDVKLVNPDTETNEKGIVTTYLFRDDGEAEGEAHNDVLTQMDFELGEFQPNEKVQKNVFLRSNEMGQKVVSFQISYNMSVTVGDKQTMVSCVCSKEGVIKLDTQMPFSVSVKTANMKFQQINRLRANEPFTIMTYVKCTSPWPIDIVSSEFHLSAEYLTVDEELTSQVQGLQLREGDIAGECQCLIVPGKDMESFHSPPLSPVSYPIGQYAITWKRTSGGRPVSTRVNLPPAHIDYSPFYIKTDMPSIGCVHEPMLFNYTIYNRTLKVQEVEAHIDSSETFMLTGNSKVKFRILPLSEHKLSYSLYPLFSGELALPLLNIALPTGYDQRSDAGLSDDLLPTHIFVKPQPAAPPLHQIQVM